MKKLLLFLIAVLFVFTACAGDVGGVDESYVAHEPSEPEITDTIGLDSSGYVNDVEEDYETDEADGAEEYDEPAEVEVEPIPLDLELALYFFTRLEELWDADNGEIWGMPLHAPVIIVCEVTRDAVANRPDQEDSLQRVYIDDGAVYTGSFSGDFIAATALEWHGIRWGMMPFGMIQEMLDEELSDGWFPSGIEGVLWVLAHEAFHAIHPDLHGIFGFREIRDAQNEEAKVSFMQELNALATAFHSEGDDRIEAIREALTIRRDRREVFNTAFFENLFELAEGLALYNDFRLFLDPEMISEIVSEIVDDFAEIDDPVRASFSFGYYSGALYALLLSELGADWKGDINQTTNLGNLLKNAAGITELD